MYLGDGILDISITVGALHSIRPFRDLLQLMVGALYYPYTTAESPFWSGYKISMLWDCQLNVGALVLTHLFLDIRNLKWQTRDLNNPPRPRHTQRQSPKSPNPALKYRASAIAFSRIRASWFRKYLSGIFPRYFGVITILSVKSVAVCRSWRSSFCSMQTNQNSSYIKSTKEWGCQQ